MDHIAFIMDGNGRWANLQKKARKHGHESGSSNVYNIFSSCIDLGINTATFFAMSSENMYRSKEETDYISYLLDKSIKHHLHDLLNNKVKFKVIGETTSLPFSIKKTIEQAEQLTAKFNKYSLNIAYNYGGQWDIINAIETMINDIGSFDNAKLPDYLSTGRSYPDLIIRTGGYRRLSNFMLWQSVYSELVFVDTLWPDFCSNDLKKIINDYKLIKRNFGKVD